MLSRDSGIDFRLIVSSAHLSATYGMTVRHIEKDRIKILDRIETLIDSDSDSARIKSASLLLQNAIHSVERFSPDLIIYAGDREDVIMAALIGGYLKYRQPIFLPATMTVTVLLIIRSGTRPPSFRRTCLLLLKNIKED